jgi:hypothetical protein
MTAAKRATATVLLMAAACAIAGCNGSRNNILTGKVTFRGQPVSYGSVIVLCEDGTLHTGNIQPNGTYSVTDLPAGPVKLAVISPEPPDPQDQRPHPLPPGAPGAPPADLPPIDRSRWFPLPEEYSDPRKSGKTATVSSGATVCDIELP